MKVNKISKFLIVFMSILMISSSIYAFSLKKIKNTGDTFIGNGNTQIDDGKLASVINPMAGTLTAIGSVVIIGLGIVLGQRFVGNALLIEPFFGLAAAGATLGGVNLDHVDMIPYRFALLKEAVVL